MLKKLSDKIGLTDTEIKIFIFLLGLLLTGAGYKYYSGKDSTTPVKFDYSLKDSLFNAAGGQINGAVSSQNGEKKFDYKQEVLDFNTHNFNQVKPKKTASEKSVNLNKASFDQLVSIPGLGDKTADKILSFRAEIGKFKNLEQLMDIKGIGIKKFNKIINYVYIE